MEDPAPWKKWLGAIGWTAMIVTLDFATAMESWKLIGLALAVPLVVSLICVLAADPRSD